MDMARHLRFFAEVARVRHFGEAAEALGMTQPPLSQGIQRLERHWGLRLFDRSARRVDLTPAGAALLPMAHRVLAALDDVELAAARAGDAVQRLRLGLCTEGVETYLAALAGLRADPSVPPVEPVTTSSDALAHLMAQDLLAAAVVRYPAVLPGVSVLAVHRIPTVLVVPSGEWDWREEPLALTPRTGQPAAHDQVVDGLVRYGWRGELVEVPGRADALAAAAAGTASTLCPVREAGSLPAGVRSVDLPVDVAPLRFALVWSGSDDTPVAVRDAVRAAVDDAGATWGDLR